MKMGNKISNIKKELYKERMGGIEPIIRDKSLCKKESNPNCLVCWEPIKKEHIGCIVCNIRMHRKCEEIYRKKERRSYCKCPHCKKEATLALTECENIKFNNIKFNINIIKKIKILNC